MTLTITKKNDPAAAIKYFEEKMNFLIGPAEVHKLIERGAEINIVDVRAAEDYIKSHIPYAVNLPQDQWRMLDGLHKDKMNIVYCYSQNCHLAARAALEFANKGFPVMEMEGGFASWEEIQDRSVFLGNGKAF